MNSQIKTSKDAAQTACKDQTGRWTMQPCDPNRVETFDYSRLSASFSHLGKPAQRALINSQIHTTKDLSRWTRKSVAKLHGIGPSAIPKLEEALRADGLSFKAES
jgi:hypothetical protein